jgi:hypothetical protein
MTGQHGHELEDLSPISETPTDLLAELEARARDLQRTEASLAEREKELAASSAAMARELREAAESLRQREQQFAAAGGMPGSLRFRRNRLANIRRTLRDRAIKLQRYEAVLDGRAREADQVLAQRREIAKAAAVVQARERKLAAIQARSKTLSSLFFVVASLAIIGVLSFAAADHLVPATYAATAEIVVDSRGRELSPDEIAEWQQYAESLLTDPGLLELAADRLKKRGLISLGHPTDLKNRLEADMTTASPEPGRLSLELVGLGAGATTRTLDTYMIALVAQSNATKTQRAGGTGSRVGIDAGVRGEPIQDQRLMHAGIYGGGASLVVSLAGLLIYRKLRAQHKAYEQGVID